MSGFLATLEQLQSVPQLAGQSGLLSGFVNELLARRSRLTPP